MPEEEDEEAPSSVSWTCEVCDVAMNVFLREDHLTGKAHGRMVRRQGRESGSDMGGSMGSEMGGRETMRIVREERFSAAETLRQNIPLDEGFPDSASSVDRNSHTISTNVSSAAAAGVNPYQFDPGASIPFDPRDAVGALLRTLAHLIQTPSRQPQQHPTFTCHTCTQSTTLSTLWTHLSPLWTCNVCETRLHADWREAHLKQHGTRYTAAGGSPMRSPMQEPVAQGTPGGDSAIGSWEDRDEGGRESSEAGGGEVEDDAAFSVGVGGSREDDVSEVESVGGGGEEDDDIDLRADVASIDPSEDQRFEQHASRSQSDGRSGVDAAASISGSCPPECGRDGMGRAGESGDGDVVDPLSEDPGVDPAYTPDQFPDTDSAFGGMGNGAAEIEGSDQELEDDQHSEYHSLLDSVSVVADSPERVDLFGENLLVISLQGPSNASTGLDSSLIDTQETAGEDQTDGHAADPNVPLDPLSPYASLDFFLNQFEEKEDVQPSEEQAEISPSWECVSCNRVMSLASKEGHISGRSHLKQVGSQRTVEDETRVESTTLIDLPEQEAPVDQQNHFSNKPEEEEDTQSPPKPEMTAPASSGFIAWTCNVCQLTMQLTSKDEHLKGRKHNERFELLSTGRRVGDLHTSPRSRFNNQSHPPHPDGQPSSQPAPYTPVMIRWTCSICELTMHYGAKDSHLKGPMHRDRAEALRAGDPGHRIIRIPTEHPSTPSPQCYFPRQREQATTTPPMRVYVDWTCRVCNLTMQITSKEPHLSGRKHQERLELQKSRVSAQHIPINSPGHESTPSRPDPFFGFPKPPDRPAADAAIPLAPRWACRVCQITMSFASRDAHLTGMPHRQRAAAGNSHFPGQQTLPARPGPRDWTCTVCRITIQLNSKESHLQGQKHQEQVELLNAEEVAKDTLVDIQSEFGSERTNRSSPPPPEDSEPGEDAKPEEDAEPNEDTEPVEDDAEPAKEDTDPSQVPEVVVPPPMPHWTCTTCNLEMHLSSKDSHLVGKRHRGNAASHATFRRGFYPPSCSQPQATDDQATFFCEGCNRMALTKYKTLHLGPMWECTLCNIRMHAPRRQEHIIGRKHSSLLAALYVE